MLIGVGIALLIALVLRKFSSSHSPHDGNSSSEPLPAVCPRKHADKRFELSGSLDTPAEITVPSELAAGRKRGSPSPRPAIPGLVALAHLVLTSVA